MPKVKTLYRCVRCHRTYESKKDAEACSQPLKGTFQNKDLIHTRSGVRRILWIGDWDLNLEHDKDWHVFYGFTDRFRKKEVCYAAHGSYCPKDMYPVTVKEVQELLKRRRAQVEAGERILRHVFEREQERKKGKPRGPR